MKLLRIILTAFFSIFAAIGLGAILIGKIPLYSLLIVSSYLCVAAALNRKGGRVIRVVAFIVTGIFIVVGILFIALLISILFNHEYDNITPVVLAIFGAVGVSTFICLRE